ncbi:tail fiber domain-containing protein, partial [Flavobacteriaceae bacterium]|nr:tail fiber domain-containing protein [Flavobacteriaceae bacterium]
TNKGLIKISGEVNNGPYYDIDYENWRSGEPNNAPPPENVGEMFGNNSILQGQWNDGNSSDTKPSYVEFEEEVTSLGDFTYLGQYNGHSYFKNPNNLNWEDAKLEAENLGAYLSSHQTIEENNAVSTMGDFIGWIGLYQDLNSPSYEEPTGGWKWVSPTNLDSNYSEVYVELYKNNSLLETYNQELSFSSDQASFEINIEINSELSKYSVKTYAINNAEAAMIKESEDIVCGDVFIVQGQSNAEAPSYNGSSSGYDSDFIRVYANGNSSSSSVINNNQWYYGQGDGNSGTNGNTGQWGLVLAKKLVDELNIPIAIFNGAHGGQPISFFQRPANYQSSTNSNYGRLYYRLNKSGLKTHVRGILWSQGEADSFSGGLTTEQYKNEFENLVGFWQEDYPSIEQYYIFQTRDCDCGTSESGRIKIKEAQRQLAVNSDNISIMPTTGMTTHSDNCHYPFTNGYEKFGTRIFKPVLNNIYSVEYSEEINAPMVTDIQLSNSNGLNIIITTDAESLMINTQDTETLLQKVSNDFVLTNANNVSIIGVEVQGSSIMLMLDGDPGTDAIISLYGRHDNLEDNITNSAGIELVCFGNYCISGDCDQSSTGIVEDQDKKPAVIFVEDGDQNPFNGKVYRSSVSGAARSGNGNSNDAFANQGDWSVDLVISERTPENAAQNFGGFTESGHPLYTGGDGNWSTISEGMGAAGWGSFAANAYNRAAGLGGVALGFNTLSGPQVGAAGGIDGGNVGQFSAGWGSRAIGNISTATGFRNTASGQASVALGNYNYATGDATIALGKENWAEGASTVAIGYKNHAAGAGSVSLGQENVAWGTTNFTAGYQNIAGDTNASIGTAGSATALGLQTIASGRSSFSANKNTSAVNQASTALGLSTISDNFGMLAIGVNNEAGIGDTSIDPNDYGGYYYADGNYTGSNPGVAFVVGNGDIDSSTGKGGDNPSNAFIISYDGNATLANNLTINSDARLKSKIVSLGSTLSRLLLIDGKSYTLKANESISKIGLLAQEVQAVFPELVKTANNSDGTLSVNYQGMIPVLLNAIKEQQAQIKELKALIKK